MPQPVVIFDFGNVLGFFDYGLIFQRFGARLGMDAVAFRELAMARGLEALLMDFEVGAIEPEAFAARVGEAVGLVVSFAEFVADWENIFELNAPVAAIAADLKGGGHPLALGSNTNAIHAAFYRREFQEALAVFDHFVLSHEVKAMKPERAFFQACLDVVEAPAAECVFIDDVAENVQGARDAGLRAIHYRDPAGLVAELRRLGIETSAAGLEN